MQRAGVMLMHNNHVYLKPADLVAHRLPDFLKVEELQAKLAEIDRQLQPFEEVHREAERLSWRLLYFGCFMLALQLAAFLRLTYFELSWDVMEPVGYMISLFYSVLGFVFFIYTRGHPFDLHPVKEWYAKRIKVQRAATFGVEDLDEERYEALVKARDRYSKRLQFLQKLESRRAALATAAVTAAAAAT
ncbi:hypothetical protein PLESTF_001181200 [Pleodorina starrii]|nr:hypothetical protein PLESTF_001181200 [Pleodorina starrii]